MKSTTLSTPKQDRDYGEHVFGRMRATAISKRNYNELAFHGSNSAVLSTPRKDRDYEGELMIMSSTTLSTGRDKQSRTREPGKMNSTPLSPASLKLGDCATEVGSIRLVVLSSPQQERFYGEQEIGRRISTTSSTPSETGYYRVGKFEKVRTTPDSIHKPNKSYGLDEFGKTISTQMSMQSQVRDCRGIEIGRTGSVYLSSPKKNRVYVERPFGTTRAKTLLTPRQTGPYEEGVIEIPSATTLPKSREDRDCAFEGWRMKPTISSAPTEERKHGEQKFGGLNSMTLSSSRQEGDFGELVSGRMSSASFSNHTHHKIYEEHGSGGMHSMPSTTCRQDRCDGEHDNRRLSTTLSNHSLVRDDGMSEFGSKKTTTLSTHRYDRDYTDEKCRRMGSSMSSKPGQVTDYEKGVDRSKNSTILSITGQDRFHRECEFERIHSTVSSTPKADGDYGEQELDHSESKQEGGIKHLEGTETSKGAKDKSAMTYRQMFVLWAFLMCFPILTLILSCFFGALFAWTEGTTFLTGFLYVASDLLGMANALTDFNPANPAGVVIDIYVSTVALLLFGIVLNVINLFNIPDAINLQIERFVQGSIIVPLIAVGVIIPACVGVIAAVFGSILAKLEGWSVHNGIYYVLSNLLGLSNALTDDIPETVHGDIVDIIISSVALGCVAVFVDYVTVLNPARYIRKRLKEVLAKMDVVDRSGDDIYNSSTLDIEAQMDP